GPRRIPSCATNSSCPSSASWLISPAFHERSSQNFRTPCADDRDRASSSFGIPCSGHRNLKNLAGSAVRCRSAGRERFLLRCRSSAPHFAGRFRKDRGRDEKGDQSESSVRKDGGLARRRAGDGEKRTARRVERSASAEQI